MNMLNRPMFAQDARFAPRLAFVAALLVACMIAFAPVCAWAEGEEVASDPYADATSVQLANGEYMIDVVLEGGTGRATVASPAKLTVIDGKAAVAIEWSSPNYDYMLVGGKKYLPVNPSGNSVFMIPVLAFDEPVAVVGDTTAMSEPHEVDYTLTFSQASIQPFDASSAGSSAATGTAQAGASSATSDAQGSAGASASAAAGTGSSPAAPAGDITGASEPPYGIILGVGIAILVALIAAYFVLRPRR